MASKTRINLDELKELILQKKTQEEIMSELDIKSIATFKAAKLSLFERDGKVYKVREPKKKPRKKGRKLTTSITKSGSLTLSPRMLANTPFEPKDKFTVKVRGNKIILDKVVA